MEAFGFQVPVHEMVGVVVVPGFLKLALRH